MSRKVVNNLKLGVFVLTSLLFLIFLLYMIGKNQSLFGSNFVLKARFENVQGLKPGNNVRYAGIDVGTVKDINIINDTTLEIVMTIDEMMKSVIRKNTLVSIGTEGFVGNKVVNMISGKGMADMAEDGNILSTNLPVNTDEMIKTLSKTNTDINIIAEELKSTIKRINSSEALWKILNEEQIPKSLKLAVDNTLLTTAKANEMVEDLYTIVENVRKGKGSAGAILSDTTLSYNLNTAILKLHNAGNSADSLLEEITSVVEDLHTDMNSGSGPLNTFLKDSLMSAKINSSLDNIQQGTDNFNQSMEALKHSFLFRKYFRKLKKQEQKKEKPK